MRVSTIEFFKEAMKFSAGHFTIFSATERERLHGHNFSLYCALTGEVDDNGMLFDYRPIKQRLIQRCQDWNEFFLLPTRSPFLRIEQRDDFIDAYFGKELIPFRSKDVRLLPLRNITLEELSWLLVEELASDRASLQAQRIQRIQIKVSSGPGQFASCEWAEP